MCDTPVIKNTPYTLLITRVDGNEKPTRPRAAFMPCHMRTMAQLWLVATAMALSNPSFAAGAACFQRGELSAARRHFEESKRLFPDDAATVAVLTTAPVLVTPAVSERRPGRPWTLPGDASCAFAAEASFATMPSLEITVRQSTRSPLPHGVRRCPGVDQLACAARLAV